MRPFEHIARLIRLGRSVAIASTLLLTLAFTASARAGTYDVYACYGGADNSWAQFADPGMAAYDQCPNNPSQVISGMTVRASVGGGAVGYLQGGYQVFSAPPGASLVQVSFTVSPYRWETHWTVGFVAFDGDFNRGDLPYGCYAGQAGCGIVPGSFFGPEVRGLGGHTQVRIEARCGNGSGCTLASSGTYPYTRATFSIANVVVRVQDFTAPAVWPTGGGLVSGQWLRGPQDVGLDASDNVGIRETRVRADGRELTARARGCDYSQRVPCPQGGDAFTIDTATIRPDGAHTLTLEAVDSAGNVGQAQRTILVDNSAPAQPQDLRVEGGEGWRAQNHFRLLWRNPSEAGTAPIVGAGYELCPTSGGSCETRSIQGRDVTEFPEVRLPAAGEYVLRLWLRDEAGNEDSRTAAQPLRLRFDDEAPQLAFSPPDPSDPPRIGVRATDRVSGLAGGEVELRRIGSEAWRPLATSLDESGLVAHLDDENLADGRYELRARAFDRAGNERSTGLRADGQRMEVVLPVRAKTELRAGIVSSRKRTRPGRRRVARVLTHSRVPFGQRARLRAQLTDASGAPITGAEVLVYSAARQQGAHFALVASLRTSRTGRVSYLAPRGPSRTLRFRYPGTATVRPATADVDLLVRGATTLHASRHFALNGETVTFGGRLRGGPVPEGGKLVELQAFVRKQWRTFATTRTDAEGRWRYPYRFSGTRGRRVYSFRARLPHEPAAYPYEAGGSHRVSVTVVGL